MGFKHTYSSSLDNIVHESTWYTREIVYLGIQRKEERFCILVYKGDCVSWYTREGRKDCVSWYTREIVYLGIQGKEERIAYPGTQGKEERIVYPGIQGKGEKVVRIVYPGTQEKEERIV